MRTRKNLIKASTVVGYVVAFLYLLLTACLFSVGNLWYWLTLILGGISLYNSLYSGVIRGKLDQEPLEGKLKIKFLINTILSIVSLPSFVLNLIAYFHNKEDKYVLVDNEEYKDEVKKEKVPVKWYRKSNFILSCIGLGAIMLGSFAAQIGETSGYNVSVRDFTLTKEMTETYNAGEENALNGKNYVISDPVSTYTFTEYRPNTASSENPLPVVIVMPGFTRTKATMSQYAIELSKRNAIVYTLDPGCQGGTTYAGYETSDDGSQEMISATTNANGLNYLVQYLYNNTEEFSYIDRNNIGAVGHSAGGGNVAQLAQNFAGNSFEESIIKAVYISGYIKESAANRFDDLRCNAAMSYAYYDEGAFRYQGSTSAFEVIARRFINEVNGEDLNHDKCIIDYEYGSMDNGTYRVVHQEKINHCFEMYDPLSISNTLNFFRRTLNLDTNLSDDSQSWFVKEGFNGVALVGSFIFIFALMAFLVDILPFFKRFRENAKKAKDYEDSIKVKYGTASVAVLENRSENCTVKVKKKHYLDKVTFWTILVLTAIIACLDYIPLARLSMDWFPDAASNTYTFYFPARMMNAVMLWALINGTIGIVLIFGVKLCENLYFKFTKQNYRINWYRFKGMMINRKDLLISIGFALFLFLLFYALVELMSLIFHQDFRFMLISAAPLEPRYIVTWLIYLVPFFIFYISNSIRVNLSMANEGWSERKVMLLSGIGNSIGLVGILVVNYVVYFLTGTVYYGFYSPTDSSEMWLYVNMVFGLIPMMFILPILNRFCFKKTGNVYFGAILTCMIFIMMSLSASVSYIPM